MSLQTAFRGEAFYHSIGHYAARSRMIPSDIPALRSRRTDGRDDYRPPTARVTVSIGRAAGNTLTAAHAVIYLDTR